MALPKDSTLKVAVEDGEIRISVGIETMLIVCGGELIATADYSNPGMFRVTDSAGFADDVRRELEREEEDGTTPVHRMLDMALNEAVESGSEHVQEVEEDEDNEEN